MRNAIEYLRLTFIKCQWKIVSWGMWETAACSAGIIIIINNVSESDELCLPSINVGIYFSLTCWMTFGDKRRVDVKYSFVTLSIVLPHCGYPWYQCPVFSVLGSSQFSGPGGVEDKWWPRSLCQSLSLYPGWQHPPERLLQRLESGRGHYLASDSEGQALHLIS